MESQKSVPLVSMNRPAIRGAFWGFCWSLPFAVLSAWICTHYPSDFDLLSSITVGFFVIGIWSVIAALVSWQESRRPPRTAREQIIHDEVRRAAISATIYSTPIALFFAVTTWGYGPGSAMMGVMMLQGMWVGSACCVGLVRGKIKAGRAEKEMASN